MLFLHNFAKVAVPIISLSLVATFGGSVHAAELEAPSTVDALAQAVVEAAPDSASVATEDFVVFDGAGQTLSTSDITLPASGDGVLTSASTGITIELPSTLPTSGPQVSSNGLAIYAATKDSEPSAAVGVTPSATSVQMIIPAADSPSEYRFEIGGAVPALNDDGSVTLFEEADLGVSGILAEVETPWAVDGEGSPVPTHFVVDGKDLVQVIDLDQVAVFPVIADPDFIFIAKCTAAAALFIAENGVAAAKFWKVFKSVKALIKVFKSLKGMKMKTKVKYVAKRLAVEAGKLSGVTDLITRCTP